MCFYVYVLSLGTTNLRVNIEKSASALIWGASQAFGESAEEAARGK